jgi:hypothetical protein
MDFAGATPDATEPNLNAHAPFASDERLPGAHESQAKRTTLKNYCVRVFDYADRNSSLLWQPADFVWHLYRAVFGAVLQSMRLLFIVQDGFFRPLKKSASGAERLENRRNRLDRGVEGVVGFFCTRLHYLEDAWPRLNQSQNSRVHFFK